MQLLLVHLMAGNLDAAEKSFQGAIDADPALMCGWWSLIIVSAKRGEFSRTLEQLIDLDQRFGVEWTDLNLEPEFAEFANSTEHTEWLKYLETKTATESSLPE